MRGVTRDHWRVIVPRLRDSHSRHIRTHAELRQSCSAYNQKLYQGLLRHPGKGPRCHVQRPLGTIGHPDERDRSVDLQPVQCHLSARSHSRDAHQPFLLSRNDFIEIMEMLDKRLNDKGKNWRHVFKVCTFRPVRKADISTRLLGP